jgi:formylglycine-generating enzyme required for sulfatase activity
VLIPILYLKGVSTGDFEEARYCTNDLGMEFVMVPAGEFQMGCSEGAKPNECSQDERPRHSVHDEFEPIA